MIRAASCGCLSRSNPPRGNDSNYCARCQTGGKIIADGGLSQLLKADRPRTLDEEAVRNRTAGH
jgi:hypothetical protein